MNQESTSLRKNLKLALLAGTCLGTGASLSNAATVIELDDFSNSLLGSLAAPLPFKTDQVQGSIPDFSDIDFVTFTDLLAGRPFSIGFSHTQFANFFVQDSDGNELSSAFGAGSATFFGNVPSDGRLVAQVNFSEGFGDYTINLTATTVPEPNAAVLAALGVSAAALRRSRREKKTP